MTAISVLELIFWFKRIASRRFFNLTKNENLETKKRSKRKGKKFLVPVVKKQKINKNSVMVTKFLQKKIKPNQM